VNRRAIAIAVAAFVAPLAAASCKSSGAEEPPPDGGEPDTRPPTPPEWDRAVARPTEAEAAKKREACGFARGALPAETLGKELPVDRDIPIDTIVVVMQENRSFDHYYGRLGQYLGRADVESPPEGATNPRKGGELVPWKHAEHLCFYDTDHEWSAVHRQYNGGKNDGFVVTNDQRRDEGAPIADPALGDGARAMWWYDQRDIPFYYEVAKTFATGDHYHCSLLGPTWPNRMFLYAGTSLGMTFNSLPDVSAHKFPQTDLTIFDELDRRHVDWSFFGDGPPGVGLLVGIDITTRWGRAVSKPIASFYERAKAGTLPAVSFVDANFLNTGDTAKGATEHPPENPQRGQRFVYDVVKALMESPQWKRSALFVLYDEHGGLYDHVPPPSACVPDGSALRTEDGKPAEGGFDRLGFRVPFMVVSPYAKRGYVSHDIYDHTSVVRFIQARYKMPALTGRDANAKPPLDVFDFAGAPNLTTPVPAAPPIDPVEDAYCKQPAFRR
jgi:phospholipase C